MSNAANADYKVKIEEMTLFVHKITVSEEVKKSLAGQPIRIPLDRGVMREFNVPQGGNTFIENNLHSGQIPSRIVFGFVGNNAHVGNYKHNPFNWELVNVEKVSLFRDGQLVNGRPLSTNFADGDVMDGFWGLAHATNTLDRHVLQSWLRGVFR